MHEEMSILIIDMVIAATFEPKWFKINILGPLPRFNVTITNVDKQGDQT